MKITIIPNDHLVLIDRVARAIDMAGIDPTIHAVQFDTSAAQGHIERTSASNEAISTIAPFQIFIDRWTAAAPVPPPPPTPQQIAEAARRAAYEAAISSDSVLSQLRTMTVVQFDAWWDANVTSAAQVIGILKRLVKIVMRQL